MADFDTTFQSDTNTSFDLGPATPFKFLLLPWEIHESVYHCLFAPQTANVISDMFAYKDGKTLYHSFIDDLAKSAQVLFTCKQIFDEARPILYGNMTFEVSRFGRLPDTWIRNEATSSFVRHVRINVVLHEVGLFAYNSLPEFRHVLPSMRK